MKLLTLILFLTFAFTKELYFMPKDGRIAENRLFYLFTHAKKEIKIIIYTFTNQKLARGLKIASKRVKIKIIADKKEAKYKNSQIPNLALIKNIYIKLINGKSYKNGNKAKMHIKMSLIDNKYLVIGSANYSYSAFYKNYEYILIEKDKKLIKKFNHFFEYLYKKAISYRNAR